LVLGFREDELKRAAQNPSHPLPTEMPPAREPSAGLSLLNAGYKLVMKRNSTYIAFVFAGAFVGERILNGGMDSWWESRNKGKSYDDLVKAGIAKTAEA